MIMVLTTLLLGREKAFHATDVLVGVSRITCALAVLAGCPESSRCAVQSISGKDIDLIIPTLTVHKSHIVAQIIDLPCNNLIISDSLQYKLN